MVLTARGNALLGNLNNPLTPALRAERERSAFAEDAPGDGVGFRDHRGIGCVGKLMRAHAHGVR